MRAHPAVGSLALVPASVREPIQHMVDQRLAVDRDQRLWDRLGDRRHALAASGRQLWRAPEFTLAVIAVIGFVALAIATGGNLLSAGTLEAFFR